MGPPSSEHSGGSQECPPDRAGPLYGATRTHPSSRRHWFRPALPSPSQFARAPHWQQDTGLNDWVLVHRSSEPLHGPLVRMKKYPYGVPETSPFKLPLLSGSFTRAAWRYWKGFCCFLVCFGLFYACLSRSARIIQGSSVGRHLGKSHIVNTMVRASVSYHVKCSHTIPLFFAMDNSRNPIPFSYENWQHVPFIVMSLVFQPSWTWKQKLDVSPASCSFRNLYQQAQAIR